MPFGVSGSCVGGDGDLEGGGVVTVADIPTAVFVALIGVETFRELGDGVRTRVTGLGLVLTTDVNE